MTVQDKRAEWLRYDRKATFRYLAVVLFTGAMLGLIFHGITSGELFWVFSITLIFFPILPALNDARLNRALATRAWQEYVHAHDDRERELAREREIHSLEVLFANS